MATVTGLTKEGVLGFIEEIRAQVDGQKELIINVAKTYTDEIAGGKNSIFFEPLPPVNGNYIDGDLWFDILNENKMYTRSNGTWVAFLIPVTIPDLSLTVIKFKTSTHQLY